MFLGELIGVPFDDDDAVELRAARADPQLMSDQIRRAFGHFIGIETAVQPLVIVLEDMHWGDSPSAKLLDATLRALPDRPWLVVALGRPEIHELFPRLWAERGAQELRLDELTKKGSERLVRGVLGAQADDALVARIVDQAAGNAFFLEELIRVAAEGSAGDLPETVLALMQGRLEQLELDARRVLRAASVFGRQFWPGGVQALLAAGDANKQTAALTWIDELVARELVSRGEASRFPGQDQLQFRHALVREAAYAMLTDADRALGHRLAGEWLAHIGEQDPLVLAEHFERGGDRATASDHYRRAAEQALGACDFALAHARAERGVACGASGALLGALQLVRAEANRWVGDFKEAGRRAREALALLPTSSARWFTAAYEAAEASGKHSDHAELVAIGELLRNAPDGDRDAVAARVTATACGAFQLYSHGHYELAEQLLDRVELAAAEVDEPGILARIYQARSSRSMFRGDAGAYLESERAAAIEFERAGDSRYACMQRGHVGYACLEIGAYREAEHWLRLALEEGVRLNLATVVATAKHNLSRALHRRGMLAEALAMQCAAIDVFREQGDRRLEAGARTYLAELYRDLGELDRAEAEARHGLALGLRPMRPLSLAVLAEIQIALGRVSDALATAREGYELLEALGGVEEGESLVRLAYCEALRAVGDHAAAAEVARVAKARIVERAGKISDEEWRRRFATQIPENARTLAFSV
jgi:tetratricopeptide (TPR) repeat protein